VGGLFAFAGAVATFRSGIYYVAPGTRAFKFNVFSGVGEKIYREGYNFKIPMIEREIRYDITARP